MTTAQQHSALAQTQATASTSPEPGAISWMRYVIHDRVAAYEALGWRVVDTMAGSNHGHYSQLLKWAGEGDPIEPEKESA